MGDAIEGLKAVQKHEKNERQAAWDNRAEVIEKIEAAGFRVELKSEESRHLRVHAGTDWFDFWPSTGRWSQSPAAGSRRRRGSGVEGLIMAAEALG